MLPRRRLRTSPAMLPRRRLRLSPAILPRRRLQLAPLRNAQAVTQNVFWRPYMTLQMVLRGMPTMDGAFRILVRAMAATPGSALTAWVATLLESDFVSSTFP